MRHINAISARRLAPADTLTTISAFLDLLTSMVGLAGEVRSVFGISALLDKKTTAES